MHAAGTSHTRALSVHVAHTATTHAHIQVYAHKYMTYPTHMQQESMTENKTFIVNVCSYIPYINIYQKHMTHDMKDIERVNNTMYPYIHFFTYRMYRCGIAKPRIVHIFDIAGGGTV